MVLGACFYRPLFKSMFMRLIIFLLLLWVIISLLSCSKQAYNPPLPIPKVESKNCMAVTYYLDVYSDVTFKKYMYTECAWHQCKVCDADLIRFQSYDTSAIQVCEEPTKLRLVVKPDTCTNNSDL